MPRGIGKWDIGKWDIGKWDIGKRDIDKPIAPKQRNEKVAAETRRDPSRPVAKSAQAPLSA